jgi:hypothetical protein
MALTAFDHDEDDHGNRDDLIASRDRPVYRDEGERMSIMARSLRLH